MKSKVIFLILIAMTFTSCMKDDKQASNSIMGEWQVNEIMTIYGFTDGSYSDEDIVSEDGDLGFFVFEENTVEYEFMRNDTLYKGEGDWSLLAERVNEGFIRVPKFTLTIENQFEFIAEFGDQTKNAEKNATQMQLIQMPSEQEDVYFQLSLEK